MDKHKIKTSLFGLLIILLLAGMVQDAAAQRTVLRRGQDSDQKRSAPATLKRDKIVKQSAKKTVRKNRETTSVRTKAAYSKNENRKKDQRDFKDDYKSDKRDQKHAYKQQNTKSHSPTKKTWNRRYYRKPAWVDYHRPGYRYPRIGMHVSVLPHGFFSLQIGNFRFYTYRGVYYRYDPLLRVYVVVNKPRIEILYTAAAWDRITLVDGSTIEGVYRYTDNDMVVFEVGDALLEIPMSEIRILSLSEN
jgi:hypothetical protein